MSWQATQAVLAGTNLLKDADYGGFRILLALAQFATADGVIGVTGNQRKCVGQARIAADARVHTNTVKNWIPRLVERGELVIADSGGNGRGRWTVYQLPQCEVVEIERKTEIEPDNPDLMVQDGDLMVQGQSSDNANTLVPLAETLVQAIELLGQHNALLGQHNALLGQANGTNGTSLSHTRRINQITNYDPTMIQLLPTTPDDVTNGENGGGGGGEVMDDSVFEIIELISGFGIWENIAIELAALPQCTAEFVGKHVDLATRDGINPQTLVWRLRNGVPVHEKPKSSHANRRVVDDGLLASIKR